jgi:hypothetical protein
MHGRPTQTGSSVAFSTCKPTSDPASGRRFQARGAGAAQRTVAWWHRARAIDAKSARNTSGTRSAGDVRRSVGKTSAGNQDQRHHGRMGHEGFEQRRPWPVFVAMNLGLLVFLVPTAEQRAAPGRTRIQVVIDSLERECAQHICCITHGGCRTPGRRWLPEAADGLSGRLEEQAIEIFDTYPDHFTACEIVDSMRPRSPELEAICHPRSSADRPSPEEVRALFHERDEVISAVLDGRPLP